MDEGEVKLGREMCFMESGWMERRDWVLGSSKDWKCPVKLRQKKAIVWAGFVRVNVHGLSKVVGKQITEIPESGNKKP